ncbi:MAG: phage holin family protein [Actinomycetales bacterium]|nr:phage holin family protein [Actinomycetales bacterium]
MTTSTDRTDGRRDGKPSIGDLVSTLSEKLSTLIRHEIELAKAEMAEKAKHAGLGIGLFVGAGVLAFWATGVLIATIILGIAEGLPAWLAALIVFVAILLVAGLMVFLGKRALEKSSPPVPERAQANIRLDVEAVRQGLAKEDASA